MVSKQRKARGTILGLALTAMLAFGALGAGAAQASPTWHVNGSEFLGEETVVTQGDSFRFEAHWSAFTCESVEDKDQGIFGGDDGEAVLRFSDCGGLEDYPVCKIPTFWMYANVELLYAGDIAYQKFTPALEGNYTFGPLEFTGAECSISGSWPLRGSMAARIGPEPSESEESKGFEAVQLPLSFSPTADQEAGTQLELAGFSAMSVEGEASQHLNGANVGEVWGAH